MMDFGTRLSGIIDSGFLCLSIAIGNELNLFKELSKFSKENGASISLLARSLQLKERYVREWIGAMYTGAIIDRSTQEGMFYLSVEKSVHLQSSGSLLADLMAVCAGVFNEIVEAFKIDGPAGVPYSRYPLYHGFRNRLTSLEFPNFVDNALLPACPDIWQAAGKGNGISVCDIGCSEGILTSILATRFPNSHFWASDISTEAIEIANNARTEKNVTYEVQDATKLPAEWAEKFDLVVVYDVIHDLARPDLGVKEIHRVLKSNGAAIIVEKKCCSKMEDNGAERSKLFTISLFHCMPVSLNQPGGWGLGAAWGVERAEQFFLECGFHKVELKEGNKGHALFLCTK